MILITGLTGTSGLPFYEILCREHYSEKIRVVVRPTTNTAVFDNTPLDLELAVGDITDVDFMTKALDGCDTLFHIAHKNSTPLVIEAVKRAGNVKNVILVSSTIVYSQYYRHLTINQDEKDFVAYFQEQGIRYCFIRPTMIFGTPTDRNISQFIRWFQKLPVFPIVNKGQADIQPVSRYDVAEGYWLILSNFDTLKDNDYIVSGRDRMTLIDMFRILSGACGKKTKFVNIPFGLAKFAVRTVYYLSFKKIDYLEQLDRLTENRAYSHEKIAAELGYAPRPFADWAEKLVNDMKAK